MPQKWTKTLRTITLLLPAFLTVAGYAYCQENGPLSRPVVVELFTSQGCSSCPPADAALGNLAERKDVLALSFHVDYWDHTGWKDPFSSKEFTHRQHTYNKVLGLKSNYTPQMVIDGRFETVGSDSNRTEQYIRQASAEATNIPIMAHNSGNQFWVKITENGPTATASDIWLIGYDRKHLTPVTRGENKGLTLKNTHVVRYLEQIGQWHSEPFSERIIVPWDKAPDFYAVIVQESNQGPMQGVFTAPFE